MPTCRAFDSQQDNLSAAQYLAQCRVGNNNSAGGAWETAINGTFGQYTWGVDGNGYLDSGAVTFDLTVFGFGGSSSGGLSVGNGTTLSANATAYTQIVKVGVSAAVIKNALDLNPGQLYAEWVSLTVTFYTSGDAPSTFTAGSSCLPAAQMTGGVTTDVKIIEPDDTSQVRVEIAGTVRLRSADPNRKAPTSLGVSQIIVKAYVWVA